MFGRQDMDELKRVMDSTMDEIRKELDRKGKFIPKTKNICSNKACQKVKEVGRSEAKTRYCSWCHYARYCSTACQKVDWKEGHEQECNSFSKAPWTIGFDPTIIEGTTWPVDPVFAKGDEQGLGIWVSMGGNIQGRLQQSWESVLEDDPSSLHLIHNAILKKWVGVDTLGDSPYLNRDNLSPETKKRMGPVLLTVKIALQNRRKDNTSIIVGGETVSLGGNKAFKDFQVDGEDGSVQLLGFPDGREFCLLPAWKDWAGQRRVCISNINGSEILATKRQNSSSKPSQVLDWTNSTVMLKPGEFVVLSAQFRAGNGDFGPQGVSFESQVWSSSFSFNVKAALRDESISIETQKKISFNPVLGQDTILLSAVIDKEYLREYFRPWEESGQETWMKERKGRRVEEFGEWNQKMGTMAKMMNQAMWSMMEQSKKKISKK